MFAAVRLGVFDRLETEVSAAVLARELSADPDALERLLDACVGLGLLVRSDGRYQNSEVAQVYLRHSSPYTMKGYILYSDQVLYRLWDHLEDAVREGTHRWKQTFGMEGLIFDHFFQTEEAMRTFLLGLHGYGMLSSPRVVDAFDLSRFRRFADLGGATGHLAVAACRRYTGMRAVVFDLPRVIGLAREQISGTGVEDRIELAAGDFFADELPEADLFAVGRILHDWSEEKIRRLLARIYARLPPDGALLIAEKLLDEEKTGPVPALVQSLNMLICTEGKERTLSEYRALLEAAGFRTVDGRRTGEHLDAVLAEK